MDIYNRLLEHFGPQGWWPVTNEDGVIEYHPSAGLRRLSDKERLEIIIGAVLTQNTSWKNVEKTIYNLNKENLLDVKRLQKINKKRLASIIRSSGYHNQKAAKLKNVADFLDSNRMLPQMGLDEMRNSLLSVNGIGPETADSIILYAFCRPSFVIDAYTRRIFSRLGLIGKDASYDEVKRFFESGLRKDVKLFQEYHALIVELGKNTCRKEPLCGRCPLENVCEKRI